MGRGRPMGHGQAQSIVVYIAGKVKEGTRVKKVRAKLIEMERGANVDESSIVMKNETIEVYERMKTSTRRDEENKIAKMKRRRPMSSEDDDDEISLREVYKSIKRRKLMSGDVEEDDDDDDDIPFIRSAIPRKEQNIPMRRRRPISVKRNRSPSFTRRKKSNLIRSLLSIYEQEEEKKKKINNTSSMSKGPIHVYEDFDPYYKEKDESEEETLGDGERDEDDWDCDFKVNQDHITYTRVTIPQKVYYKNSYRSVLSNEAYPVPTITKLALDRYNAIEGTDYRYVGLVKAYAVPVNGFSYTIRFKARLPDQDPIYFQARIYQQMPTRATNVSLLDVGFVHPLPMSQKVCRPVS